MIVSVKAQFCKSMDCKSKGCIDAHVSQSNPTPWLFTFVGPW